MKSRVLKRVEQKISKAILRRWTLRVEVASQLENSELRRLRMQARDLRWQLNRFLREADGRLARPYIGSNAMQLEDHTDWSYRPAVWRGPLACGGGVATGRVVEIGEEVQVLHDCKNPELIYRQIRNTNSDDLAPFGISLEVFSFKGSFLSIVVEPDPTVNQGLSARHIMRIEYMINLERSTKVFLRLNIKHGPNLEQIVRDIEPDNGGGYVDIDLAYTKLNEKRVEKVWVEFLFEDPAMNKIVVRDCTLSRRPRAEV